MIFEFDSDGNILKPSEDKLIKNTITNSRYLVRDCKIVESNGKYFVHPIFSTKKIPITHFDIDNWEIFKNKPSEITISDRHIVSLDGLKISNTTDNFNILLITYLNEISGGSILTTNPTRVKHILAILRKKPETPLPWKYVDEILDFATSTKALFFQWLIKGDGELIFNKYISV